MFSMGQADFSSFIAAKSTCKVYEHARARQIIHLPTHEGLDSQFNQLEKLWSLLKAMSINKTIVAAPILTHHFKEETHVQLCDIFQLPDEIECSCSTSVQVGQQQSDCSILGFRNNWATHAHDYGLNGNNSKLSGNVDLSNVTCVAGMLNSLQYMNRYKDVFKKDFDKHRFKVRFAIKYQHLAGLVLQLMPGRMHKGYIAAHWRRGDQLTTRCKKSPNMVADTSVNCGTAVEFVSLVETKRRELEATYKRSFPVYVATNEDQKPALDLLHTSGYFTFADIISTLRPHINLTSEEIFVLELVLMCYSTEFLYWGESGVHDVVERCKRDRVDVKHRLKL